MRLLQALSYLSLNFYEWLGHKDFPNFRGPSVNVHGFVMSWTAQDRNSPLIPEYKKFTRLRTRTFKDRLRTNPLVQQRLNPNTCKIK